ncbi:MAG: tetratricopeptide repeat protein, partial [Caulobacteraceae bacterium]
MDFDALRARLKAAPDAAAQVRAATDIVAAHGDKPEPYVWLAEAHWRLGDLGEALAVVDRGLARFPRDLRLLDRGQRLAKAQDDTDLAIAYCLRTAMIPSQR